MTGTEVDLLANEDTTGERIFVECKAHRKKIEAEVLFKILGHVNFRTVSAGWLISTSPLTKDAKGVCDEWQARPPEERRKLQVYEPNALVKRLIGARVVCSLDSLLKPPEYKCSEEAYLLLTLTSFFWAIPLLDQATGVRVAAALYDAHTGIRIDDPDAHTEIRRTDTTLASLNWLSDRVTKPAIITEQLGRELQSIVSVPIADNWADYRPARPEDFVGRADMLSSLISFLDRVRQSQTATRLIAVKGPSGWGKSSFVLKLAAQANRPRNKNKYYVFAVDSRAATTRRFGELAIFTAIREALKIGFINTSDEFTFGGADNPFSTQAMSKILTQLDHEKKVICVFFDQFEELLYKSELYSTFDEMRALCHAVEESQGNVVIGFSWKTDGTIPPEHRAYHLWHSLVDHRFELELPPFTHNDVVAALNRFAKELGQPLVPQLRRLLLDHCQGYPWLLKKLCVHIFDAVRSGMEQSDILLQSLNIQQLFKREIESLTAAESACIKQIASESPAEFFKIINVYGDDIVNMLLHKRLIDRRGTRLSIYWDIFRDYVLTEKVPHIPVTYIPQANYSSYVKGLKFLLVAKQATYQQLAEQMSLSGGATDNVVRDLISIGHAEANRKAEIVKALQEDEEAAAQVAQSYCRAHVLYQRLVGSVGLGSPFSEEIFMKLMKTTPGMGSFSDGTWKLYSGKMLRWFAATGLVEQAEKGYVAREPSALISLKYGEGGRYFRRGSVSFYGEAPPGKAIAALKRALSDRLSRRDLEKVEGRNSVTVLTNLGILGSDAQCLYPSGSDEELSELIREKAASTATVEFVAGLIARNPGISGFDVGREVGRNFECTWSEASARRNGTALRQWARWIAVRSPKN